MSAPDPGEQALLVVIDPVARRVDGESVRIARDVLRGGAATKICLPEGPEEVERALARRGRRRPVVIGDDRALLHVVTVLHRRRELADVPVSVVPVGPLPAVSVARRLGVPLGPVAAARAVLDGLERPLDVLVDDSGGVILGGLWIPGGGDGPDAAAGSPVPAGPNGSAEAAEGGAEAVDPAAAGSGPGCAGAEGVPGGSGEGHQPWWSPAARTARSALTLLTGPAAAGRVPVPGCTRLRIEADGVLITDLDRPVTRVSLDTADDGLAELAVHTHDADAPLRSRARRVTVSGPAFRYRADNVLAGPVRRRTWTAAPGGWRLTLPRV
ncbi:diacylglycerol kinase [Streptomyces klenkii]|uniref:diacylglycerol kinase n=1 Tax=Streptomyces klenkii TaxID=1420899 RepID=UPI001F5427E5|nr:diacylglycerol kinase [Streptomyces klenkii]